MNLPNKLTLLRVFMVPVFMIVMIADIFPPELEWLRRTIAAVAFILTGLTDMLDGKIARKRNLITNFGKFMDPLADKVMVFGAMLSIIYRDADIRPVFVWAAAVVMFRELAVTSVRLVACGHDGSVIAASKLGKIKTVCQIICICTVLLEPVLFKAVGLIFPAVLPIAEWHVLAYLTMALMIVMTVWSGFDYIKTYWSHISPNE